MDAEAAIIAENLDIPFTTEEMNRYIRTQKEFLLNMEEKMRSPDFLSDTRPILLPSIPFDPQTAYTRLCNTLLSQLDIFRSQAGE